MHHQTDMTDTILFGALFSGAGIAMLAGFVIGLRKGRLMDKWPSVSGTITESTTFGSFQQFSPGDRMWIVEPKLTYIYSVAGTEYTGKKLGAVEVNSASEQAAKAKIAPYPVGKQVPVYYDPANPSDAYLDTHSAITAAGIFGILGAAALLIGIFILCNIPKH